MYDQIEDVLVDEAKVAVRLPTPVFMNAKGEIVNDESNSVGCKVQVKILRPDMCITMNEVGYNLTQEKDGAKGGEKFLCGVEEEPYQCSSTRNNHFTCLGLTTLSGDGVMCVIIIQGKKRDLLTETGINWEHLYDEQDLQSFDIADGDEATFFQTNYGCNKLFPGGPTCRFKGHDVPAFVTFTDHGGIDGATLTEIFARLDSIGIYREDRLHGYTPFVLMDGHQSRFELEFLEYINHKDHPWKVCLGVPYGTALWQVGDSSEQNGKFKMLINEKKNVLFRQRLSNFTQKIQLNRTDIIPLVNYAFYPAFCNQVNNAKAIRERGWFPYNRVRWLELKRSKLKFE